MPLLLLFVILPIIEIFLIIEVKESIGGWSTLSLVVLTAVVGTTLLRQQGWKTLQNLQTKTAQGELPAQEMIEGVMLFVGGALLLTPGFVTDAFGLACLIPVTRKLMAKGIMARGLVSANNQFVFYQSGRQGRPFQDSVEKPFEQPFKKNRSTPLDSEYTEKVENVDAATGENTIEGEFIAKDE